MTQATEKKTTAAAKKTAPKAPAKRRIKTPAKKVEAAAAPKVNTHVAAGINVQRYTGPSKFVNGNRRVKVLLGQTRDKLSDRSAQGLYALRECYGSKPFEPKGFDNGVLRNLLAMGLIKAEGGSKQVIDGASYLVDGAKPVVFTINEQGMAYGKA